MGADLSAFGDTQTVVLITVTILTHRFYKYLSHRTLWGMTGHGITVGMDNMVDMYPTMHILLYILEIQTLFRVPISMPRESISPYGWLSAPCSDSHRVE